MDIFRELKRRNVFKVGAAYLVVSWLVLQIVDTITPILGTPEWVDKTVLVFLLVGFPIALIFAWAFELTPDGLKKSSEVNPDSSITPNTGHKINVLITSVLVLVILLMAGERFLMHENSEASGPDEVDKSIAVLPFEDFSPDNDQDYFSKGIAEEILNLLAKNGKLKVAARTSSFAFKGLNENIREIGQKLEVAHVLEGSIRKAGNTIRITAQLIRADNGYHLWSETYDRELNDIFAIQDEISAAILEALEFHLLGEAMPEKAVRTQNMDAYNAYLIGKERLALNTREDYLAARDKFEEAIRLDPEFAPAYVHAAHAWIKLGRGGEEALSETEVDEKVLPLLEKVSELAPDLPEGIAIEGLYQMERLRYEEAKKAFDKAIELNPNYALAYVWRSRTLKNQGKYLDMLADNEKAYELDPMSLDISASLADDYRKFWRPQDADRIASRMMDLHPHHPQAYSTAIQNFSTLGHYGKAILLLEKAIEHNPDNKDMRERYQWAQYYMLGQVTDPEKITDLRFKHELYTYQSEHEKSLAVIKQAQQEMPEKNWPWDREMHVRYDMGDMEGLSRSIDVYIEKMDERGIFWRNSCDMYHVQYFRKAGKTDGVDEIMEKCRTQVLGALEANYFCPCSYFRLVFFAILEGRVDDAVKHTDEWLNNGDSSPGLENDPLFRELRDHPRFPEFIRRNNEQIERQRQIYRAGKSND